LKLAEIFCALPEAEKAPRVTRMNDERIVRLEEKVAYLERHVTAQDKVMLELGDAVVRLRAELRMLRERASESGSSAGRDEGGDLKDERPPHY
jgi:SlyX protein